MTRDRGVSTPLDVALGILLVGAAVGVLVGIQPAADPGPAVSGSVMLGSPMEVTYQTHDGTATVTGTMGGLIGDATLAGHGNVSGRDRAFREAVRATVDGRLDTYNRPIQIVGYCRGTPQRNLLVAGRSVPPDRPIRATVYEIPTATHARSDGSPRETTVPVGPSQGRDDSSPATKSPMLSAGNLPGTGASTHIRIGAGGGSFGTKGLGEGSVQTACEPAIVVRRWSR